VLVGDPQQLPATVRSAKGRELDLERSLFERLQRAGCPVRMLSVQYRMHPAIRQFPSDHFYAGRLEDGCDACTFRAFYPCQFLLLLWGSSARNVDTHPCHFCMCKHALQLQGQLGYKCLSRAAAAWQSL
jgi:hypothetical protein